MIELPSPCLVVLVGPSASGKTHWAVEHLPGCTVSSDALRAVVGEGPDDLRASVDAFALLDDIVARRCKRGLTTVIDSLGSDPARRERWRVVAAAHHLPCVAVVFDVPSAQLRLRNRSRADRVPGAVLDHQISEWPAVLAAVRAEAFDAVHDASTPTLVAPSLMRRSATTAAPPPRAAQRGLTFGLQIPQFTWPGGPVEIGPRLRAIAAAAERGGLDSLWVMDHFRQIPSMGPAWADMLESWTTLAHLAACTESIRLGTLVSGITYRNVAHLGKIVATLDVLSGGRVTCGIGLGWFEPEHRAYGWEFPSRSERYALLEDALRLLPQLWGPGGKPFTGRRLTVPDTTCYPRPLQAHVPVMVGGSGEQRTLRLVAEFADACNLFGEPDVVARKVDVLRAHCADGGRDPDEISVSHLSTVLVGDDPGQVRELVERTRPPRVSAERHARSVHAGTIDQHVERIHRLVDAGVDQIIVSLVGVDDPDSLERWARVVAGSRTVADVPNVTSGDGQDRQRSVSPTDSAP